MPKGERKKAKPCRVCGCEERYVNGGGCPVCAARNISIWRKKNPERSKVMNNRWKNANPEKVKKINKKAASKRFCKRVYGAIPDPAKTEKRRALEERQMLKEMGVL